MTIAPLMGIAISAGSAQVVTGKSAAVIAIEVSRSWILSAFSISASQRTG
jgi:hypothetical protein